MDINITGRKMTVSEPLKEYVNQKVGAAMKTFDISPMKADVVLHVEKNPANPNPAVAEITLVAKKHIIRTEEAGEDMYAAIDIAAAKVARQLRKYKTRVIDKRVRSEKPSKSIETQPLDDIADDIDRNEDVVRVKEIELQPLTQEEALIQMDLLGHDFFVYEDVISGATHVLYRRHGGGYGLIKAKQ
ncbi:MAG: ribosome hibernation-promoting factor, HPF/YfiA family [Coriobacteriales bacterium]|jgi:putative sigma-54 modulation protein